LSVKEVEKQLVLSESWFLIVNLVHKERYEQTKWKGEEKHNLRVVPLKLTQIANNFKIFDIMLQIA
jgi:hypothetical protein